MMTNIADNELEMFANLPDVPLLRVFSYLSGAQILQLHYVCKRWHHLVLSAAKQLPKVNMDFSLVITEDPYAEILSATETEAKTSFQCHIESMRYGEYIIHFVWL